MSEQNESKGMELYEYIVDHVDELGSDPKEIVDNFSFSYVKEANIGKISTSIDKTNNSITWTIPELKSGETAIVQYKLKLKENFDENIINKVLNTNRKLDVTYTDSSNTTNTKSSDITPKVKLTENLPTELPKAGTTIFFGVMGIVVVIAIAFGIKYILVKNIHIIFLLFNN